MDIRLFDHSWQQMEALLEARKAHSVLQKMTFHTTSLVVKRVCATVDDWPHLFGNTQRTGGSHNGSGRRAKRQLLIIATLGTVSGRILWNEISGIPQRWTQLRSCRTTWPSFAITQRCSRPRSRRGSTRRFSSRRLSRSWDHISPATTRSSGGWSVVIDSHRRCSLPKVATGSRRGGRQSCRALCFSGMRSFRSCLLPTALRTEKFSFLFIFPFCTRPFTSTIYRTFPYLTPWESLSFFVLTTPAHWRCPRTQGHMHFWIRRL